MERSNKKYRIIVLLIIIIALILATNFLTGRGKLHEEYLQRENQKLEEEIKENAVTIEEGREKLQVKKQIDREIEHENIENYLHEHTYPERGGKAPNVD